VTHLDILRYTKVLEFGVPQGPGVGLARSSCAKNLPRVGGEVYAKFGGDWSGSSGVKRVHRHK